MSKIKSHLLEFIWSGKDIALFEDWLYDQNSIEFEELIGESSYLELISFNFKKKTSDQVKQLIKSVLPENLIDEFEEEFKLRRSKTIKGICLKDKALNYSGDEIRCWDVEIGKEYEFLSIHSSNFSENDQMLVSYVDRDNFFRPSGSIPMELFDLSLEEIPEPYHRITDSEIQKAIELKAFSKENYKSINGYSFWEDFYNDDDHAVNLYYDTLEKLGIKDVW